MRLTTEMLPQLAERPDIGRRGLGEPADYRDVGDSLTIGLSTAEIAGERDWFDLGVTISVDGRELPFAEVFAALASGESHMLLADGAHFSLLAPELQELRRLIEEARALAGLAVGAAADQPLPGRAVGRARRARRRGQSRRRRGSARSARCSSSTRSPSTSRQRRLQAQLRPYQRDGFGWLASLWDLELGGILADDMGLGKTLQALALICHARERDPGLGPFLVVAPTSVVSGWVGEAARFAPELRVDAVTDTLARSRARTIDEVADRRRGRDDVHAASGSTPTPTARWPGRG